MKKICIFSAFYPPHQGGVERYVRNLSQELKSRGHEVIVVSSNTDQSENIINDNGVKVYKLPVYLMIGGRYPLPKFNSEYRTLIKKIAIENADIYITNMRIYPHTFIGISTARKSKKPVYLIEHVSGYFELWHPFLTLAAKIYEIFASGMIKNKVDKFFAVSKASSKHLKEFKIDSSGEIYNGIDGNYEYMNQYNPYEVFGIDKSKKIICAAGRLIREKGFSVLCKAFVEFNTDDYHLIIAGSGPQKDKLLNDFGSINNIHFAGEMDHDDLMDMLKQSQIAVIPSYYPEGLPTFALEAGLSDCAVLATKIGGNSEIIINKETGLLISPRSVESIKDSLALLESYPDLPKKLSLQLKQRVLRKFTWDKIVNTLEKHF